MLKGFKQFLLRLFNSFKMCLTFFTSQNDQETYWLFRFFEWSPCDVALHFRLNLSNPPKWSPVYCCSCHVCCVSNAIFFVVGFDTSGTPAAIWQMGEIVHLHIFCRKLNGDVRVSGWRASSRGMRTNGPSCLEFIVFSTSSTMTSSSPKSASCLRLSVHTICSELCSILSPERVGWQCMVSVETWPRL